MFAYDCTLIIKYFECASDIIDTKGMRRALLKVKADNKTPHAVSNDIA